MASTTTKMNASMKAWITTGITLASAGVSGGKYTLFSSVPMPNSELMLPESTLEKKFHVSRPAKR